LELFFGTKKVLVASSLFGLINCWNFNHRWRDERRCFHLYDFLMRYSSKEYISYAISFCLLQLVLFYVFSYQLFFYSLLISIFLILVPITGIPILNTWKKITLLVGKFNGLVILSLLFFLLLTPLAWMRKIVGKKVSTGADSEAKTYFDKLDKSYTLEDIKNMW